MSLPGLRQAGTVKVDHFDFVKMDSSHRLLFGSDRECIVAVYRHQRFNGPTIFCESQLVVVAVQKGEAAIDLRQRTLQCISLGLALAHTVGYPYRQQFTVVFGHEAVAFSFQSCPPGVVIGNLAVVNNGDIGERSGPEWMAGSWRDI